MAEWLCSGLQSRGRRFDSGSSLINQCPGGGIGRRKGLKIPRDLSRASSSLAPGMSLHLDSAVDYARLTFI
jgi:hypothetical protein